MNYSKSLKQVFNRVIPFVLSLVVPGFLIAAVSAQPIEPTEETAVE
ncbi:hypothetical protein K9N68_32375 [Kovacikia minuta CCNUW1]|nr:hypothetical protein [Kovacikia minuta]UBF26167.1 hypothetical protein K9N68_32375 [Kovacikia minuta CCNUW1]